MPEFSLGEIKKALGLPHHEENIIFSDVVTDTRKLKENALFVAFKGESFNAEDFLREAREKGATGAIVSESCPTEKLVGAPKIIIKVGDTLEAYQKIAAFHRNKFTVPVIAITGSNGKTTTKDLVASVLSSTKNVLKTEGNFNNEIGLPLTLLQLNEKHEAAVTEMGMRGRGQIAALAKIASPTIGIVTNVGETHLELLGTMENIAAAKGELVEAIEAGGTVILNNDNNYVAKMREKVKKGVKLITFGIERDADIKAEGFRTFDGSTEINCKINGETVLLTLPLVGRHNVYNALAAVAAGSVLGLSHEEIKSGLKHAQVTGMRFERITRNGYNIINDAYNASPMSMEAAIKTLAEIAPGRRIFVLGDMLELGEAAKAAHQRIGELVGETNATALITYGELAKNIAAGARAKGMKNIFECESHDEAAKKLKELLLPDDTVLFKGSRGMKMEKIIELL